MAGKENAHAAGAGWALKPCARSAVNCLFSGAGFLSAFTDAFGEGVEHGESAVPVDAAVCDADAVLEGFLAFLAA